MGFLERLEIAAAHAGVPFKQSAIARIVSVSRQTAHQWFHGTVPETPHIANIAKAFGVDATWLASGEGNMIPGANSQGLSADERDLIRFYRKAQPSRKKAFYDMAKALGKAVVVISLTIPALTMPKPAEAALNINKFVIHIGRRMAFMLRRTVSVFKASAISV